MAFSLLNNISSEVAQNNLSLTSAALQKTLFRLSSGSQINSGADDAAGLAIADGLAANITALQQSAKNANDGVGSLQVADGSLAQVTTLLNRAVTLATESANGTVSNSQRTALNAEFSTIATEINSIGTNTTYNSSAVFTGTPLSIFLSDAHTPSNISVTTGALSAASLGLGTYATGSFSLTGDPTAGDTVTIGAQTYTFKASIAAAGDVQIAAGDVNQTLKNLAAAVNGDKSQSGTAYFAGTASDTSAQVSSVSGSSLVLQALTAGTGGNTIASTASLTGNVGGWANGSATLLGATGAAVDLLSAANAQTALTAINNAIATVASTRGGIGAGINQLQAAVNVTNNQVQNLSSAENDIRSADIGAEVANLSRYQILTQTGIAALAQANSSQQAVLKLLQ